MQQPFVVGILHRFGHLRHQRCRFFRLQRLFGDKFRQVLARNVLQTEVGQAVVLANIEDRHDPRMRQPSNALGLDQKPLAGLGSRLGPGQDHLEGRGPAELLVAGEIDHAHAAPAEFPHDEIGTNRTRRQAPRRRIGPVRHRTAGIERRGSVEIVRFR